MKESSYEIYLKLFVIAIHTDNKIVEISVFTLTAKERRFSMS